jgi:transcriptional regulator with PAS, ATPase and Fis domain
MPIHFHLISDHEIERLAPILHVLRDNRDAVLNHWYKLYAIHFGNERSLSKPEFELFCGADLDGVVNALLAHDIAAMTRNVREVGVRLVERGVPFAEIVASLHLFEESTGVFFRRSFRILSKGPDLLMIFDKLSHVRMIILSQAYFGAHESEHVARTRAMERDLAALDPTASKRHEFHGLVGGTTVMRQLYGRIQAAAAGRSSILIAGESGTGKELVARAVHECDAKQKAPFIAINCAALPKELIESELFGHRKGAFSGATDDSVGLVRAANGGTLFLDEITEMLPDTQAKLLRVLQERRVRPVGSVHEVDVDVRFIASTNRPAAQSVAEGRLREDLYYRLKVHTLALPPLRERLDDVPMLVEHFVDLFNVRYPREVRGIDAGALEALMSYAWPGNVRELMNAIEVAFAYGDHDDIRIDDLPAEIGAASGARRRSAGNEAPGVAPVAPLAAGKEELLTFEQSERSLLERALSNTGGNKLRAAKMLGISRKQLYAKIRKYAIPAD